MAKKRNIDWLNHALEFFVVIIGILIAFQLNTCRDNNKEQKLIDKHISNVLEETTFNEKMFVSSIESLEKLGSDIQQLQDLQASEDASAKDLNSYAFKALNLPYLYLQKNAYNSLKGSNDIRFIKDFEQQSDIIELYENYIWTEGTQTATFNTYDKRFFAYFMAHFDLTSSEIQPKEKYTSLEFKNIVSAYKYSLNRRLQREKTNLELVRKFNKTYNTTQQ